MYFHLPHPGKLAYSRLPFLLLLLLFSFFAKAEGTANLRTSDGDPVMLFVGNPDFGNFATYSSAENSRLNFSIAAAGEVVYFGMARAFRSSGVPESFGQYNFRIKSAADGSVVFGPIRINADRENLTSFEQAQLGPEALVAGGYPTDQNTTFEAPAAGEYYIEFDQVGSRPRYIGMWDITIASQGVEQVGRVYSRNWAFRVPELEPQLPECAFGAELSTKFFSYTSDGFVTEIDFTDSGFQPLSFNLAFNRSGPGETGNLLLDRQSIAEENATNNVAEHLIFLEEPDANLFPDGACGSVEVSGALTCQEDDTFCIPITATLTGQVQILLDFNSNGVYDATTDRLLAYRFTDINSLEACVPWDGVLADGTRPADGATVDIIVDYTQGVQHWALYDGELMRNGFCVTPVRPICGEAGTTPLYYDDINIPDDPGNGAPKRVLTGCECRTGNCRTWTNFDAYASEDCSVNNDNTTGYGDRNTLNTWWFASSRTVTSFDVPIDAVSVDGPLMHCPEEDVALMLNYAAANEIETVRWTGPQGPIPAFDNEQNVTVGQSGIYTVIVTDEFGCESTGKYMLMDVECDLNLVLLGVACDDNGTDTDARDDVFTARVRVEGANSANFVSGGVTYDYGVEIEIGPFPIAGGNVVFSATDAIYDCCTESININAPMACSDGCAITTGDIVNTTCIDPGTPTDPTDDEFTFSLIIDGINLGDGWTDGEGMTGNYGEMVTFGPYLIADGAQSFEFTDVDNPDCVLSATVQPPMPCSDECILEPEITNAICDDNGTPFDLTDDVYFFDLMVAGTNTASPAYSLNGIGASFYNQTITFGPFRSLDADYTFVVTDLGGGEACTITFTLPEAPAGCEPACSLNIEDARVVCNDFGTEDEEDDEYAIEILVTTENPLSSGWELPNGTQGAFDEYVNVGRISPGAGELSVMIFEQGNRECTAAVNVTAPSIEVICPDDVTEIDHKVGLQRFGGELTTNSEFEPANQEICWQQDEVLDGQRRYFGRYAISRMEEGATGLRLFSFYLYAPAEVELLGAVFSQQLEETLDCCHLTNDGPVSAAPTNARSLPIIPDSLRPDGMVLQQRFSVALRPDQIYTLIVSSPNAGVVSDYEWLVVSAEQEELFVQMADGPDPVSTFSSGSVVFDLLNFELTGFLNDPASIATLGGPEVEDLCGVANIAFTDEELDTCDRAQIVRSFGLDLGDTTLMEVCEQNINFRALGIMDITWPESQIRFGCSDTFPTDLNNHPAPSYTGYPYVYRGGVPVALSTPTLDNLIIDYADVEALRPDGGTNIHRTWTVQDPCRFTFRTYTQLIKLENNGLPFFTCPVTNHYCPIVEEDIMLWATGFEDCLADIEVPQPELANICDSANWVFTTEVLRLELNGDTTLYRSLELGDSRLVEDVPPGDYFLHFIGSHPQEVIEDRYCRIRVADLSEPVTVCKTTVNLSLPGSGQITVPVSIVNQGSYDNCGIDTLQIRRWRADSTGWSDWNDVALMFDCEDVGTIIEVQVEAIDAAGNRNFCTSYITIKDNTEPYCTGLESVYLSCDDLPGYFNAYDTTQLRMMWGMPEVIDNCSARAVEFPPIVTGDNCSPERIRRRFQAVDQHGNLSTGLFVQDIHVTPSLNYAVRFPMDTETDCTDFVDTLLITGAGCDSITMAFVDIFLPTEGEECRYVQRNFVVTNWCEWDGVSPSIRVNRNENCSDTPGDADVWLVRTDDGIFIDTDSLPGNNLPAAGALCNGQNPEGYVREVTDQTGGRYVYSQRFKVFDTTAPELALTMIDMICVDTSLCRAEVPVGIQIIDACQVDPGQLVVGIDINNNGTVESTSETTGELTGVFPNYVFTTSLPIGDHRYVFTVTDDCGNTSVTEREFRVNDCYVPALVCRGDRIYNLQPLLEEGDIDDDGIIEEAAVLVEAVDLAQCNFLDCSGDLTFSVNRVGEPADINMQSIFLDCGDRYEVYLEVYVWDETFNPFVVQPDGSIGGRNWRSCVVKVRVQDPGLACNSCQVEESITVNGHVNSLSGTPLDDVTILANDGETLTNNFGAYQIGGTVGESYVLSASKDVDPRIGLSAIDLVIMQRHLLGIETFSNPFMRVAADINRDGFVDLTDFIQLRALILARREMYPVGSMWRFVADNWDGIGDPQETILLSELASCSFDHDFIGLRLGDLNDSYGADAGAANGGRSNVKHTGRPVSLELNHQSFRAGELVTVAVNLPDVADYIGGQLALSWNTTTLEHLDQSSVELDDNGNIRVGEDHLWLVWGTALEEDRVMTLRFRALKDGLLAGNLFLAADLALNEEVYDQELGVHPLLLTWTEETITDNPGTGSDLQVLEPGATSKLLGVLPNPARNFTRLGILLNKAQSVDVTITDLNGRVLKQGPSRAEAGEQWIRVDVAGWPTGVYLFNITTSDGHFSGRIVKQ
ncbi:T9SS type A sorting domain-containing protein [Neolewinella persica]|uniref:T9SS type A sorting domain-containing protein n=1 Tax=Neolewinella persica TaxID=70998 RepID=UPI000476463F|nr:T9SS type A sorting domain-containing protein [Neolewinella persica]